MIVKNEEQSLCRCLESISPAVDEIVIVDTGSTDRTKEIALRFTDKVYDFKWCDDFSLARNYSFSFAKMEYIMWLDADDVITKENLNKLIELKKNPPAGIGAFYFKYYTAFDSAGEPTFSYYRERIVKRTASPVWVEPVHEVISYKGTNTLTDIAVEHRKIVPTPAKRNLKIFENTLKSGKTLSARLTYYYARELMYNGKIEKAISVFKSFLKNKEGWTENKIEATRELSNCYRQQGKTKEALESLLSGFLYDCPRAESLCKIGEIFIEQKKYTAAAYWYSRALECTLSNKNLGFVETDYYNFIPYMQLCLIYSILGDNVLAEEYNEKAGKIKPNHPSYLHNKTFFNKLKNIQENKHV